MGTDRRAGEGEAARTDTMILTTVLPLRPYVGMLSIPRDLWVEIPGFGPNRINAAYFISEAARAGSGPAAAVSTVSANFGLDVDGYIVVEFGGFVRFVDALGGVEVVLAEPMGGYDAGRHHLDGTQALAFVRDRKDGDDFFRMAHAQAMLRGLMTTIWRPFAWPRLPLAAASLVGAVRTNVPVYLWPRLAWRAACGPGGIDGRAIRRDNAPLPTEGGAQVLAPDWSRINPVLLEMFGQ
jgi:LCP family protein required for cell wall assembly